MSKILAILLLGSLIYAHAYVLYEEDWPNKFSLSQSRACADKVSSGFFITVTGTKWMTTEFFLLTNFLAIHKSYKS